MHGSPIFRHYDNMGVTIPAMLKMVQPKLFQPEFFVVREIKHLGGIKAVVVAPIARYPNGEVRPDYQVSTRGNGVDRARWPEDLGVEVVT
jgi:hypothetical protein